MMQMDIDQFFLLQLISKGTYAKVYLVKKKDTNKLYALKKLKKKVVDQKKQAQYVTMEKAILNQEKHQFIVYPQYSFQQENYFYFASEYCEGGDLFSLSRAKGKFKEKAIQFYAILIIHALQFLHIQKIIYRDLKPENIQHLYWYSIILIDEKGYIKLTDFGLSKILLQDRTEQVEGTFEYLAPEILNQNGDDYDYKVDCWSLGCLLYELIAEHPPFMSEYRDQLPNLIKTTQPKFNFPLSDELKDLITSLLQKDPKKRPSLAEIKGFSFFKNVKDWESYLSYRVVPPFLPIFHQCEDFWRFDPGFTQYKESGDANYDSDKDNKFPDIFGTVLRFNLYYHLKINKIKSTVKILNNEFKTYIFYKQTMQKYEYLLFKQSLSQLFQQFLKSSWLIAKLKNQNVKYSQLHLLTNKITFQSKITQIRSQMILNDGKHVQFCYIIRRIIQ